MAELLRSEYWIQTYTGRKYDFVYNHPEDINIVDIAHALSQKVRFEGHLQYPYSIAQHSLTVSAVMRKDKYSKEVCLQALMHDSHEAYIPDFTRPLQMYLEEQMGVNITALKEQIDAAISERFGIDLISKNPKIEKYDDILLRSEAEDLFERPVDNWPKNISEYRTKDRISKQNILPHHEAKNLFIQTFKSLGGKI